MKKLTTRRTFCATLGATSVVFGTRAFASAISGGERPNVVYILTDDLGWVDLDVYNKHSAIPTPNANAFAREGMRFTDMHASSAVCTPSRYSILTGCYC